MNLHIMSRWIILSVLIVGLAACTTPIPPSPTPTAFASVRPSESSTIVADSDKALQLQPDWAKVYFDRGNAYYGKGDNDRAIADYNKAVHLKPDYVDAYYNRGLAYQGNVTIEHTHADFKKDLDLTNDHDLQERAVQQLKALSAQ